MFVPESIEQWGQWEQKWQLPSGETYENPFLDVEVTVEFTLMTSSADGLCMFACMFHDCRSSQSQTSPWNLKTCYHTPAQVISARAFYDGDKYIVARFMPPETGLWGFVTHSSTTSALNGRLKKKMFSLYIFNSGNLMTSQQLDLILMQFENRIWHKALRWSIKHHQYHPHLNPNRPSGQLHRRAAIAIQPRTGGSCSQQHKICLRRR